MITRLFSTPSSRPSRDDTKRGTLANAPGTERHKAAFLFITPTLKVSGGNLEIVKLARDLADKGHTVRIVAIWAADHSIDTAGIAIEQLSSAPFSRRAVLWQLPLLLLRFSQLLGHLRVSNLRIVFTHYATFPLSVSVRQRQRWYFVQDAEWQFVSAGHYRRAIKAFVLFHLRRGRVLTTNSYLTGALQAEGVRKIVETVIWADRVFAGPDRALQRSYDLVLVLRHGAHKRADLALELIERIGKSHPALRIAAITPDQIFADAVADRVAGCFLRPSRGDMQQVYARTGIFVLLSEHEGFGLPPLEAMGSGCIPLCRDAGGVRAYMVAGLAENIIPLSASIDEVLERILSLLGDSDRLGRLSREATSIFKSGLAAFDRRMDDPGLFPFRYAEAS